MKTGTNKKKQIRWNKVILIIGIVVVVIIALVFIVRLFMVPREEQQEESETVETEEKLTDLVVYGDSGADSFEYSGEYFDRAGEVASMEISRDGDTYSITIRTEEDEDSSRSWDMTATYDDTQKALMYSDCTGLRFIKDPADPDAAPTAIEEYSDGDGAIYKNGDNLFWVDHKDDAGSGMLFVKRTPE